MPRPSRSPTAGKCSRPPQTRERKGRDSASSEHPVLKSVVSRSWSVVQASDFPFDVESCPLQSVGTTDSSVATRFDGRAVHLKRKIADRCSGGATGALEVAVEWDRLLRPRRGGGAGEGAGAEPPR